MRRLLVLLSLVGALVAAATALAQPPSSPPVRSDRIFGVVPSHELAGSPQIGMGQLQYHGGPTMHTNTTRAIYWFPAGSSYSTNYVNVNNGFLQNVAADSGKTSNVYFSDTQYSDSTSGRILYSSSFAGSVIDTNPFPASGCSDSYTSICLSDKQLQTEISRVITAQGWPRGMTNMVFLYTPKNVGSCYSAGSCAFSSFCAYHSAFGSGSSTTIYANQPYAAWVTRACDTGQHPNGDDADATINVVSHEHNEAITDPLGNAWFDMQGYENGDKCAWNFGYSLGRTAYGTYNQIIGSGKYYVQQEWSNAHRGCVLRGT
jgi:hypothetical protein